MALTLGWVDYIVWFLMLVMSLSIGVFFAFFKRKNQEKGGETKEFLLGGRQMSAVPVACSLMASFFSAITLLGTPNEIYQNGVMYVFIGFAYIINLIISVTLFIPVYYHLDITSSYEYLGLRFCKVSQVLGAVSFILQMTPYMGIVLYGPALALSLVINVNVWIVVVSMAVICTIYTTLGGIKAVVWTDVLQLIMMFTGMAGVIIKGSIDAGGFNNILKTALDHERLIFNISPDPRTRHSIWSLIIGGTFLWTGIYAINQTMVQRAICVKSSRQAKIAYLINLPGMNALLLVVVLCGLVIFHFFNGCDPLLSHEIGKSDQILPLYVSRVLLKYPGVTGIFVAGIFSGGLSTMSSGLNSLAAVTLQDIIMLKYKSMKDTNSARVSKILVIVYGILTLIFAYLSSLTNKILEAALGLFGMLSGPLLGVFTLGMFLPFTNSKGAISSHIISQIIIFWIGFGFYANDIHHPKLIISNFNCSGTGNITIPTSHIITQGENKIPIEGINNLYAMSYLWYSLLGWVITLLIGIPVSLLTKRSNEKVPSQYISPPFRNYWKDYLVENDIAKYFCVKKNTKNKSDDLEEVSQF